MNDRGRQVLTDAQLAGVPQVSNVLWDAGNGRCALGVLVECYFRDVLHSDQYRQLHLAAWPAAMKHYGISTTSGGVCPECGSNRGSESALIAHLNNTGYAMHSGNGHGLDFIGVARKLPDTEVQG